MIYSYNISKFIIKSSSLKPSDQFGPNFGWMVLECSSSKILTLDPLGNSDKNILIWKCLLSQNQTFVDSSFILVHFLVTLITIYLSVLFGILLYCYSSCYIVKLGNFAGGGCNSFESTIYGLSNLNELLIQWHSTYEFHKWNPHLYLKKQYKINKIFVHPYRYIWRF